MAWVPILVHRLTGEGAWDLPALNMPLWHDEYFEWEARKGSRCRKNAVCLVEGTGLSLGRCPSSAISFQGEVATHHWR